MISLYQSQILSKQNKEKLSQKAVMQRSMKCERISKIFFNKETVYYSYTSMISLRSLGKTKPLTTL